MYIVIFCLFITDRKNKAILSVHKKLINRMKWM